MSAVDARHFALVLALVAPVACGGSPAATDGAAPATSAARGQVEPVAAESGAAAAAAAPALEGPAGLRSIEVRPTKSGSGRGHALQISAEYEVGAALPKRSGLHARVICAVGAARVFDVVSLASYHADFREMKAGDHKSVKTSAFWLGGLPEPPSKCQLDVVYADRDELTEVGEWCWTGTATEAGACEGLPVARPPADVPLLAEAFEAEAVSETAADGQTAHGLSVRARLRFAETQQKAPNLHLRAACGVGDRRYVDVAPYWPRVRPFDILAGEELVVAAGLFRIAGLPGAPESCELSVSRDAGWNQGDELAGEACWDGQQVVAGPCWPSAPRVPAPISEGAAALARPRLVVQPDPRDPALHLARFDFEVDVASAIEKGTRMKVSAVCDGQEHKASLIGPDLSRVHPGEAVRLTLTAYAGQPLSKAPARCDLVLSGSRLGGQKDVPLGRFCVPLEGDAKPGACE